MRLHTRENARFRPMLCVAVGIATLWLPTFPEAAPAPAAEKEPAEKTTLPEFSERNLMAHVRFLASEPLQGRRAGTPQEQITAAYIVAHLEAAGVPPFPPGMREQEFPLRPPKEDSEPPKSRNILGYVRGSDPKLAEDVIVIGAHMDHLGRSREGYYPGAEDNATGVAVLLEIAAELKARPEVLGCSVLLVFFGAEELHMVGSRHFVQNPPVELGRIRTMINLDMIGRPLADQAKLAPLKKVFGIDDKAYIGVVGAVERPFFRKPIETACKAAEIGCFGTRNIPLLSNMVENLARNRGDNAPFEAAGIPTLFFGSGESDDYHRTTDTVDKIVPVLLASRTKAVYATLVALSKMPAKAFPERKKTPK